LAQESRACISCLHSIEPYTLSACSSAMMLIARFALIAATVAAATTVESPTCDETSLLQVANTINTNRGPIATEAKSDASVKEQKAPAVSNDPGTDLAMKVFKLWQQGKLKGDGCKDAVADFYTTDAVIDARGPQDTELFKKYDAGHEGVCAYFNQASVQVNDLKVHTYMKGDKLMDVWSYIPSLVGKDGMKSLERVTQCNMVSFNENKTKITGAEMLFDDPHVLDKLKFGDKKQVTTPQMETAAKLLEAFTTKKMAGGACKKEAALLFAKDVEIDQTPYMQKFAGLDGVCDYVNKSYQGHMHNLTSNMYVKGDDVVLVLNYVPGVATDLDVKAPGPVIQYNLVSFHKDDSRVSGFKVFFDDPSMFVGLAQAVMQKMMAAPAASKKVEGKSQSGGSKAMVKDEGLDKDGVKKVDMSALIKNLGRQGKRR